MGVFDVYGMYYEYVCCLGEQRACRFHQEWNVYVQSIAAPQIVWWLKDLGLLGSTDLSGRGTTIAEDAQGTPTQSHISPSILVYEDQR